MRPNALLSMESSIKNLGNAMMESDSSTARRSMVKAAI